MRLAPTLLLAVALAAGCAGTGAAPSTDGARIVRFSLESSFVRRKLDEIGVLPAGGGRGTVVFLHGRGMSPADLLWDELFHGLSRLGKRAPDVLIVDGGDHSYYHDRREGAWGKYVMREAIPQGLRRLGADSRLLAIGGISMGGFGALDLARLYRGRFCAVGGHSAALWQAAGETPRGAFDDARDFADHDIFGAAARSNVYGRARVWLDVGSDDPFRATDTAFARLLRKTGGRVTLHVWKGDHEPSYWRTHIGRYLRFYADSLAACARRRG